MPKIGMRPLRRQQAAEAALRVIAHKGLASTTIRDVAAAAGVSAGTVNHFFLDRQELLAETLRWNLSHFETALREALATVSDPWERLATLIDYNLCDPGGSRAPRPWTYREAYVVWLEYWAAATRDADLRRLLATSHRQWRSLVAECIRYGIESERFRPVDAAHVARLLTAFMTGIVVEWLVDDLAFPEHELADMAKEMVRALLERRPWPGRAEGERQAPPRSDAESDEVRSRR
jgi:AcrR family transcriptional regulator